jgi:hypothetical protein
MIQLTASQKASYWRRVQGALKLAGAPTELALELVLEVDRLPDAQQELFYHAEPLDVARDLSGVERWSDEQVRAYIEQSSRESKSNVELEAPITALSKAKRFNFPARAESKSKRFYFLSASISSLALTFSLLVLVLVSLQQTSPLAGTLSILAGGVAALTGLGALLLLIALPAYKYMTKLQAELHSLQEELIGRNRDLEKRLRDLTKDQRFEQETTEALAQPTPSPNPRFSSR